MAVGLVTAVRLKNLNDVGRATPNCGCGVDDDSEGACEFLDVGTVRDTGRARGGIVRARASGCVGRAIVDGARDADPALDAVLEVDERGGAFPTYPHCPDVVFSRWRG